MKKQNITLKEYQIIDGLEIPWSDPKGILPGADISKIPRIFNDGEDCYIRAKIDIQGIYKELENCIYGMDSHWKKGGDDYYYYTQILEHGDSVDFFQGLTIPEDLCQETYEDQTFTLTVDVDAIESQDYQPAFETAYPWREGRQTASVDTGDAQTISLFLTLALGSLFSFTLLRKKKVLIPSLILFLILAVVLLFRIPSISAHLTAKENIDNSFTIGENTLEVSEEYETPIPGEKTIKKPGATNTGSVDCYVRAKVLVTDSRVNKYLTFYTESEIGFNTADWEQDADGWHYYKNVLHPNKTTNSIFTHIYLSADVPETYENTSIDVLFESVQSDGYTSYQEAFSSLSSQEDL